MKKVYAKFSRPATESRLRPLSYKSKDGRFEIKKFRKDKFYSVKYDGKSLGYYSTLKEAKQQCWLNVPDLVDLAGLLS